MKILWITNQATPQISNNMGSKTGFGGGWMADLSLQLAEVNAIQLCIAFPVQKEYDTNLAGRIDNIQYFGVPLHKDTLKVNKNSIEKFSEIILSFKPDIVHIWGTEYLHSYFAILACKKLNLLESTVISIQGLVSIYALHYWGYLGGMKKIDTTFRDIVKRDSIIIQQKKFTLRGKYEVDTLKIAKHIIGRTDWDKACTEQINSNVTYHFCNETLRSSFYNNQWSLEKCQKHSIFVSQANYPIKGLHMLIEAMPQILSKYPNAHIYTTGKNRVVTNIIDKLKQTSYDKYLMKLIKKYNLENHITFLGMLNEQEMCERFCKSHVFVSASSIENSPNSVGEAMMLGVPVVSSDVGGVKNMLTHGEEGYVYPADEPYMLAYYVCKIFDDDNLALKFSQNAKENALKTHDKENNLKTLLNIYQTIKGGI